jgi:hypothetical protein
MDKAFLWYYYFLEDLEGDLKMEQKEKINILFTEKYDHNVLSHFIPDHEYCAKADIFIKQTLTAVHPLPHEINCECLFWKTKELPLLALKGDLLDTTKALVISEGKGLVEFVFNSTKCHYSFCRLESLQRVERTDYQIIVISQGAVVPCAEIVIYGMYQTVYRISFEGHKEVEQLDKFLAKLKTAMLK